MGGYEDESRRSPSVDVVDVEERRSSGYIVSGTDAVDGSEGTEEGNSSVMPSLEAKPRKRFKAQNNM